MTKRTLKLLLVSLILILATLTFAQNIAHMPAPNGTMQMTLPSEVYQTENQQTPMKSGRTELLFEDFSGGAFGPGWTIVGGGDDNWNVNINWSNAGGTPPEAYFGWSPSFTGNSKLVTPEIATAGYSSLVLEFKHYVWDFAGSGYSYKVETTSDGGTTWNEVWSVSPTGDIGPETLSLFIENDDVGSEKFQFAFTFEGNTSQIDSWYFDDVFLRGANTYDAGVVSINIPALFIAGTDIDPLATVTNMGSETVTFDVTFEIIEGTAVYSETVTAADLAPLGVVEVTFPNWTAVEGNYIVEVTVGLAGDENPLNDMLSQALGVANGLTTLKPLFEVFTSSTCVPCPVANAVIDSILGLNPNEYSIIKYQMNWPGSGDPYFTEEGGVRRDYYEINSVPDLYINSERLSPPTSLTQEIFEQYALTETALEINVTEAHIDEDDNISVSVDLTSIVDYAEGLSAHMVVVEKRTFENTGNNGETEFHYVMMKMLPDASGTTLDALSAGIPHTLTASFDMDETNMETPNDLALVVFIQDESDKSIIQSEIANVTITTGIDKQFFDESSLQIYPNPAKNLVNIQSSDEVNKVQVLNLSGQIILGQTTSGKQIQLSTSELEPGIYFVKVFSHDNVITKKLVIE